MRKDQLTLQLACGFLDQEVKLTILLLFKNKTKKNLAPKILTSFTPRAGKSSCSGIFYIKCLLSKSLLGLSFGALQLLCKNALKRFVLLILLIICLVAYKNPRMDMLLISEHMSV